MAGQRDRWVTMTVDGRPRRALLRLPDAGGSWPLVLALHGTGSTASWMAGETRLGDLAASEGWAVAFPEGTLPTPGQPHSLRHNPLRWNDGSPVPAGDATAGVDDARFLAELLGQLAADLPLDPARVYVTGFSNGAGMAVRFADASAERVAALAPVAGLSWVADPRPARPVPTLYLIGDADPLVPLAGGEVRLPWGYVVEKPPALETLRPWEAAVGPGHMTTVVIPGHGHHWPGGRAGLNPRFFGPVSDAVDANRAIADFFRGRSL